MDLERRYDHCTAFTVEYFDENGMFFKKELSLITNIIFVYCVDFASKTLFLTVFFAATRLIFLSSKFYEFKNL